MASFLKVLGWIVALAGLGAALYTASNSGGSSLDSYSVSRLKSEAANAAAITYASSGVISGALIGGLGVVIEMLEKIHLRLPEPEGLRVLFNSNAMGKNFRLGSESLKGGGFAAIFQIEGSEEFTRVQGEDGDRRFLSREAAYEAAMKAAWLVLRPNAT